MERHKNRGISGKVILLTGGCQGLGKAILCRFLEEGAKVAVVCRNKSQISEFDPLSYEGRVLLLSADITRTSDVERCVAKTLGHFGTIDCLINNAGREAVASLHDISDSFINEVFSVNVKSCILFTKLVVHSMIDRNNPGSIVNVASQAGIKGEAYNSVYCASKFALIGFSQSIALELARYHIRVNTICPGPINTGLLEQSIKRYSTYQATSPEDYRKELLNSVPLKNIANPQDIAGSVIFLCSNDAQFITGASITLSGGLVLH